MKTNTEITINNPKDLADLFNEVRETIIIKVSEMVVENGKLKAFTSDCALYELKIEKTTFATYMLNERVDKIRCVVKRVNGGLGYTLFMNDRDCPNDVMRCTSLEELRNLYSNIHYQIKMSECWNKKELERLRVLMAIHSHQTQVVG